MQHQANGNVILQLYCCLFIQIISVADSLVHFNGNLNQTMQNGHDYLSTVGIPLISRALLTLEIPDVSGKTESPIGDFKYTLSNIMFNDVMIPKSNLRINQSNEFEIEASNATLSIDAKWTYRQSAWPHLSDSGSCHLAMEKINLKITCQVDSRDELHPEIRLLAILLKIGHMKLRFHGGASWLYNVFADSISDDIQDTVENLIKNEVTSIFREEGSNWLKSFQNATQSNT